MTFRCPNVLSCLMIVAARFLCAAGPTNPPAIALPAETLTTPKRPPEWAILVQRPPIANCYQVTTNLYRGAQPDTAGMNVLKTMGVRTVVNLRSFHSDRDETAHLGFKLQRLHMKPWHAEEEDVVKFLKITLNTNNYPIFVHCQRGADRTGLVCAMYRVVVCDWTKSAAIEEMTEGGFKFDPRWKNIVRYIEQCDVDKIRREIGWARTVEKPD